MNECRGRTGVPPVGRFTHRSTATSKETNITLQDGCFGVATLMRIAALFIPSTEPPQDNQGETAANPAGKSPLMLSEKGSAANSRAQSVRSASPVHSSACKPSEDKALHSPKGLQEQQDDRPKQQHCDKSPKGSDAVNEAAAKPAEILDSDGPKNLPAVKGASVQSYEDPEQGLSDTKLDPLLEDRGSNAVTEAPLLQDHHRDRGAISLSEKASEHTAPSSAKPSQEGEAGTSSSDSSASNEGDVRLSAAESERSERQPVDKADQISIEIIRCRAVCPDWQDSALSDSPLNARPDTLVLAIPHLLLQLPPSKPAVHPSCHPVQVIPIAWSHHNLLTTYLFLFGRSLLPTCVACLEHLAGLIVLVVNA